MNNVQKWGKQSLLIVQDIGLLIVALATVVALGIEVMKMIDARDVTLADLLLMFIYLEVFAMISIYLESGKLPVRMPLYIAIVALARYLILDMKGMDTWKMVGVAAATLILALTILVIRYGHVKFPYTNTTPPDDNV